MANDNLSNDEQRVRLHGDTDLNRRILALVAGFRLLLAAALVLAAVFQSAAPVLGVRYPQIFIALTCVYAVAAIIVALSLRGESWRTTPVAWAQLVVDISCIALIVHTSSYATNGIEALLVVLVVAIGMTLPALSAYLAAALAALTILLEQAVSFLQGAAPIEDFINAGAIGAIMLGLALAVQPLVRRVNETAELARQQGIDLRNLAQLNEYIIQQLREAILVIDEKGDIRLLNQTAKERLGNNQLRPGMGLREALPQLNKILGIWRDSTQDLAREMPSFLAADGSSVLNAHFVPLSDAEEQGPVLVFLEDASLLEEKVQQSKLAALGRLSASIAHEIRNPVGALSHAAQLLQESPEVGEQDQRFIDIIQTNSRRVSKIIDNILQLSRKEGVRPQRLHLHSWIQDFVKEFESTHEFFEGQVSIVESDDVEVSMDPSHLHQVIWNLCENAVKYASETAGAIAVEIRYGRMPATSRPFLEISDHGPGIPEDLEESVFEPFATGGRGGTGLGLYICRELCERNRASLRYRSRDTGGSTFQIVFADPARWENRETMSTQNPTASKEDT